VEINSYQILQARNVAESDIALLRVAELAHALGRDEEARKKLDAFDAIWPRDRQPPLVAARAKQLSLALHSGFQTLDFLTVVSEQHIS
jgi:hypothetical protein